MLDYAHQFLVALLVSITIESLVVLGLATFLKKDRRIALIAVFGTMLTIPYVWFVFPTIFWYSATMIVYCGEGFAFLFEAALYRYLGKLSWPMAFLFSAVANSASYFLPRI